MMEMTIEFDTGEYGEEALEKMRQLSEDDKDLPVSELIRQLGRDIFLENYAFGGDLWLEAFKHDHADAIQKISEEAETALADEQLSVDDREFLICESVVASDIANHIDTLMGIAAISFAHARGFTAISIGALADAEHLLKTDPLASYCDVAERMVERLDGDQPEPEFMFAEKDV